METIFTQQEIEQQITEELKKLKKAIAYIEEAKNTVNVSEKLLAAMNDKLVQIQEANTDSKSSIGASETKLQKKIASNKKQTDEALQGVQLKLEKLSTSYESELLSLIKSNKKLKVISYFSLGVSVLFLVGLITILIAAISTLSA